MNLLRAVDEDKLESDDEDMEGTGEDTLSLILGAKFIYLFC